VAAPIVAGTAAAAGTGGTASAAGAGTASAAGGGTGAGAGAAAQPVGLDQLPPLETLPDEKRRPPMPSRQRDDDDGGARRVKWVVVSVVGFFLIFLIVVMLPILMLGAIIFEEDNGCLGADCSAGPGLPAGAQPFMKIYADAAKVYGVNQYLLMAVHEDETDYGRSTLPGVESGTNGVCCAGPMQFAIATAASPKAGGRGATWEGYRNAYKKADLDRPSEYPNRFTTPDYARPNVYDSYDAIYAAAAYFDALGAGKRLDEKTLKALQTYKGVPGASNKFASHDYHRAKELELIAKTGGGALPSSPARTLARLREAASYIDQRDLPYCWGGGHRVLGPQKIVKDCWDLSSDCRCHTAVGLDCSGAVRWLLVLAGFKDPGGLHSSRFLDAYDRGEGEHFTIWSNDDHVFVTIDGKPWGTSYANPAHGPGWAYHSKAGFHPSHPRGL
jgi:hypothetical protein